jgi:GNAT superfamily N-acetyltransferase
MPSVVRPARSQDISGIVDLARQLYNSMGLDANDPAWGQAAERALGGRLGTTAMAYVAASGEDGTELVGAGAVSLCERLPSPWSYSGPIGYIQWVFVRPEWRRQGLAGSITEKLLAWAAKMGAQAVELHATPDGEPLYRSLGFEDGPAPNLRIRLTPDRPARQIC